MSETIEESYNKLVNSVVALESAIVEICGMDVYTKILIRQEEILVDEP